MSVPSESWSELTPAGGDQINAGDNRIRQAKTQIREVISVDHLMASSGQSTTTGYHKQVTLIEAADIGSGASGLPILGAQTVNGKPELMFTDEDNNDIQLTTGGQIFWIGIFDRLYPIGIVITLGVNTAPNTLFGRGTWTAIAGKVIVGINSGDSEFDTLDETGGEKTHTLITDEIPAHEHSCFQAAGTGGLQIGTGYTNVPVNTSSVGGGLAHNNLQPYIVKYVWQRTA